MKNQPQSKTPASLIGRDIPLSRVYDHFCLVEQVHPVPQVSKSLPFGFLTARCHVLQQPFVMPIRHKLDCEKVKEALHFRSLNPDTELVLVVPQQHVSLLAKLFRPFFPTFHLFAFPSGTYAAIADEHRHKHPDTAPPIPSIKPLRSWPLLRE